MRTIAWSQRVGEAWTHRDGTTVEIAGDHAHVRLVLLRARDGSEEWISYADLERDYEQSCCTMCGMPLTLMRKLLVEEAMRNQPPKIVHESAPVPRSGYVKATPGSYCTKPCCATRHAPKTC